MKKMPLFKKFLKDLLCCFLIIQIPSTGFAMETNYNRTLNIPAASNNTDLYLEISDYSQNLTPRAGDFTEAQTPRMNSCNVEEKTGCWSDPVKRQGVLEYGQIPYYVLFIYAIPFAVAFSLPSDDVNNLFWFGLGVTIFNNTLILAENAASFPVWWKSTKRHITNAEQAEEYHREGHHKELGAIIAAYLPNEIGEMHDTLNSMVKIDVPEGARLTIIVAHNGGSQENIEQLRSIINELPFRDDCDVLEMDFKESTSKSHNVNGAVKYFKESGATPSVCAIYDADHQPNPESFKRALVSLDAENADILQGRCVASRVEGFLGNLVSIEFDIIYGVNHPGGMVVHQFAIFGGTNGYWNFDTLDQVGMDPTMLTEDIDSAFRALRAGKKIIFDPLVITHEEAPPTLQAFIKQRFRWTQGWSQVAKRSAGMYCDSATQLNPYQKVMAGLFLHWREVGNYVGAYTLPAAVASYVNSDSSSGISIPLIVASSAMTMVPAVSAVISQWHVNGTVNRDFSAARLGKFCLVAPAFEQFKNALAVIGHYRNLCGMTKWKVTKRKEKS
ncbi:MAG: glycosyltransferase family 2 protein [Oligoflexales bacterium]